MNTHGKRFALPLILAALAMPLSAAPIEGVWRTIDDATGKPKASVRIAAQDGVYNGTIIALAPGIDPNCGTCDEGQKGKPLVGRTILKGLRGSGDSYEGGRITDPKSGKEYSAKAQLENNGQTLKVRGFLGISLLGRTQTWQRESN